MENLIRRLHDEKLSCVVANGEEVRTFVRRGVIDLYELQKGDSSFLKGAMIADKVVGKAAAALMVLGGISRLYTDTVSTPALSLLRKAGVEVEFAQTVAFIKNRDGSDWCPLEKRCFKAEEVSEIYALIDEFVKRVFPCLREMD